MFVPRSASRFGARRLTALLCVGGVLAACGSSSSKRRPAEDAGLEDAKVVDAALDAEGPVVDGTPLENLGFDAIVAVCAPFEAARQALLADTDALLRYHCVSSQFLPGEGGGVEGPDDVGACETQRDTCLEDTNTLPDGFEQLLGLSCDGPGGVGQVLDEYAGEGTVGDLKACLESQLAVREQLLTLGCEEFVDDPTGIVPDVDAACAAIGFGF